MPFDRNQIEARPALNLVASSEMPQIALDALEAGLDGKAIRRLAVLERPTYFEVAEVLPQVLQELGLAQVTTGEAALRIAKGLAEGILQSGDDPLKHLREFESLWVRADYDQGVMKLGTLKEHVWVAKSSGQSESKIREWVMATIREFASQPKVR